MEIHIRSGERCLHFDHVLADHSESTVDIITTLGQPARDYNSVTKSIMKPEAANTPRSSLSQTLLRVRVRYKWLYLPP